MLLLRTLETGVKMVVCHSMGQSWEFVASCTWWHCRCECMWIGSVAHTLESQVCVSQKIHKSNMKVSLQIWCPMVGGWMCHSLGVWTCDRVLYDLGVRSATWNFITTMVLDGQPGKNPYTCIVSSHWCSILNCNWRSYMPLKTPNFLKPTNLILTCKMINTERQFASPNDNISVKQVCSTLSGSDTFQHPYNSIFHFLITDWSLNCWVQIDNVIKISVCQ